MSSILGVNEMQNIASFFTALWGTELSISQHCGEPMCYPSLWGPVLLDRPPTSLDLSDMAWDYPVRELRS
jgi:hypothetical protein